MSLMNLKSRISLHFFIRMSWQLIRKHLLHIRSFYCHKMTKKIDIAVLLSTYYAIRRFYACLHLFIDDCYGCQTQSHIIIVQTTEVRRDACVNESRFSTHMYVFEFFFFLLHVHGRKAKALISDDSFSTMLRLGSSGIVCLSPATSIESMCHQVYTKKVAQFWRFRLRNTFFLCSYFWHETNWKFYRTIGSVTYFTT